MTLVNAADNMRTITVGSYSDVAPHKTVTIRNRTVTGGAKVTGTTAGTTGAGVKGSTLDITGSAAIIGNSPDNCANQTLQPGSTARGVA